MNGTRINHSIPSAFRVGGAAVEVNFSIECSAAIPPRGAFASVYLPGATRRDALRINEAAVPSLSYSGAIVYFILDPRDNRVVYIGEAHSRSPGRARKTLLRHFQGFARLPREAGRFDPSRVRFRCGNATYPADAGMQIAWFPLTSGIVAWFVQTLLIQRFQPEHNGTDHSGMVGSLDEADATALLAGAYYRR